MDCHEKLRKIINIGHKHEEVGEWLACSPCGEAHAKWKVERKILKKKFPEQFQAGKFGGSMEMQGKVHHKL